MTLHGILKGDSGGTGWFFRGVAGARITRHQQRRKIKNAEEHR